MALLAATLQSLAAAADAPVKPECRLQQANPDRIVYVKDAPSYFAKISPDGRYMYYIASGNRVVDLEDPSAEVILPGNFDPVPLPPLVPQRAAEHFAIPIGGMSFYKISEVKSAMIPRATTDKRSGLTQLFTDDSNSSNYQSAGALPGRSTYRMVTGSLTLNEYEVSASGAMSLKKGPMRNCGDLGRYQLPMISKDGTELAVYDTKEGVTKIMGIKDDGSCFEKLNLGFPTGKVEFSYDGGSIAFHVDSYDPMSNGQEFSGVYGNLTKNVYTLALDRSGGQLAAGALRRITANTREGTGSYYPSFSQDGKVTYMHGERDPSTGRGSYSFRTVDPNSVPASSAFARGTVCVPQAPRLALGALWSQVCSQLSDRITATDASLWTLSLDPDACVALVRSHWSEKKGQITADQRLMKSGKVTKPELDALTGAVLEAACPRARAAWKQSKVLAQEGANRSDGKRLPTVPKEIFEAGCRSCHAGGQARDFNWDTLTPDEINNMLIAIESGAMPRDEVADRYRALRPLVEELQQRKQRLEQQ
jgi:hypothetical protein